MTLPADIPNKPYFRIGEVARLLGVETHVLRYWESEFPQLSPVRAASKQRLYRREDLEKLLEIRRLVYEERYTIAGARRRLFEGDDPGPKAEAAPEGPAPKGQLSLAIGPPAVPTAVKDEVLGELKDILRLLGPDGGRQS